MNILRFGLRGLVATGVIVLLVGILGAGAATSGTSPLTNPKHFFWAPGQAPAASVDRPRSRTTSSTTAGTPAPARSASRQKPAVYLIWWGPDWASGFHDRGHDGKLYSSKTLQTYLQSFFAEHRRQRWANIQTQYCADVLPGSTSCVGGTGFVTNPKGQLKGVWTDPTPVPSDIVTLGLAENLVDDPIAAEAHARAVRTSATTRRRPTSSSRRRPRSRPASPSTAATTPRRRPSTASATRAGSSTRSSRG